MIAESEKPDRRWIYHILAQKGQPLMSVVDLVPDKNSSHQFPVKWGTFFNIPLCTSS